MGLVGVGALVGLVVGAMLARWRVLHTFQNRLDALAVRLSGATTGDTSGRGADAALSRLESLADQRVAEQGAVSVSEARLVRALQAVPQGMVICDERGEVVFNNDAASEYFTGRPGNLLVETAIQELVEDAVAGTEDQRTLDLFGPPRRRLVLTAIPLDDGQRHAGALVVVEDVSERRRLDAVRRDFVANISHELKTPVGALGLLAETLLDEDDPEVAHRLAERMLHEAERVGRTIDDLLELSRIEAQELPARDPVAVHVAMAEAADRAIPAADLAGISIELREPSTDLVVLGDRRQLVSALYNLLENGVKYSDKGSTIVLSAVATDDGAWVEIRVADHGIGIPARDLERIFERFYRVDRARSRETGGTGLGLAIVRHVAGNHAGDVRVESHEGEGSTFTLRLPGATAAGYIESTESS